MKIKMNQEQKCKMQKSISDAQRQIEDIRKRKRILYLHWSLKENLTKFDKASDAVLKDVQYLQNIVEASLQEREEQPRIAQNCKKDFKQLMESIDLEIQRLELEYD